MNKQKTKVSIIINSFNRERDLERNVRCLLQQNLDSLYEIIVVDNSYKPWRNFRKFSKVRYIYIDPLKENVGIKGWNIGEKYAKGEFLLILDDDSLVADRNGVRKMIEEFERISKKLTKLSNSFKLCGIVWDIYEGRSRIKHYYDFLRFKNLKITLSPTGQGMLILKSAWESVNGYDENFFLFVNENDIAIRLLEKGYIFVYTPNIKTFHAISHCSLSASSREKKKYFYTRNQLFFVIKHIPLLLIPVFLPLCILRCLRRFRISLPVLKGIKDGLFSQSGLKNLKKRKPVSWKTVAIYLRYLFSKREFRIFGLLVR